MYITNLIAAGALLAFASAIPLQHQHQHHKRAIEIQTKVAEDIITHTVWTTVFVTPGATPAASPIAPQGAPQGPPQGAPPFQHQHWHLHGQSTRHIVQTVHVRPEPAPSPGANSAPAPPPQPSQPPAPGSQPPAQAPSAPAAPPSAPPQQPSAPPQAPSAPPSQPSSPPQTPTNPQPSPSPSGNAPPSTGQKFSGDITYYTPGLGSCGVTNTDSDAIVALAEDIMSQWTGNPNDNPNCGKSITISHGGVTAQATIQDTCPGCSGESLDLSPTLFEKFAALGVGRVSGVEWWFN